MTDYDSLTYEQYSCVLKDGSLSLDALRRIVKHDRSSGWHDAGANARSKALKDGESGTIPVKKQLDQQGDALYGVSWPLPLRFARADEEKTHEQRTRAAV